MTSEEADQLVNPKLLILAVAFLLSQPLPPSGTVMVKGTGVPAPFAKQIELNVSKRLNRHKNVLFIFSTLFMHENKKRLGELLHKI